jgi:hypothetical protein
MHALIAAAYVWSQVVIPGKNATTQFGINDRGEVAVTADDGTTGIYRNGKFTPLPAPPASCACAVTATGVNDSGVIVGISTPLAGGAESGFLLSNGTYTFFSWAGWDNTEPRGIGDQGLVVGFAWNNDFFTNAGFVYDPATGTFTNVTPGSGYPAIVQGINRSGRIAGSYITTGPRRLFALVSQIAPLQAFGATQVPFQSRTQVTGAPTRARGINDYGVTAGFITSDPQTGAFAAYVGNDTWGYELVVPPGGDAPNVSSLCTGINNRFEIACATSVADTGETIGLFIGRPTSPQGR